MRYLGGKNRTCRQIAGVLNQLIEPGMAYWEPFCGACWVTQYVVAERRYASDIHPTLIAMWRALRSGWTPPDVVTEDDYARAMAGEMPAHLEAFVLFGCSFSGKYRAGYARDGNDSQKSQNYAEAARNSLLQKMQRLGDVAFLNQSYADNPPEDGPMLIYCDPPYEGTSPYTGAPAFEHAAFWQWARDMQGAGHIVLISEYAAPGDFTCVLEMPTQTSIRTTTGRAPRFERLFRPGAHAPFMPTLFDLSELEVQGKS